MTIQRELFSPAPLPEGFEHVRAFLSLDDATSLEARLMSSVEWVKSEIIIFGKPVVLPRLTAWYGDAGAGYVYSGIRNDPLPWNHELLKLRDGVSRRAGVRFNSVLLNRYRSGADSVSWHSDDESELGPTPTIGSLSLGATRRFRLRNKETRETHSVDLGPGDLVLMHGESQRCWEHCLPKTKREVGERINLTFRVVSSSQSQ